MDKEPTAYKVYECPTCKATIVGSKGALDHIYDPKNLGHAELVHVANLKELKDWPEKVST